MLLQLQQSSPPTTMTLKFEYLKKQDITFTARHNTTSTFHKHSHKGKIEQLDPASCKEDVGSASKPGKYPFQTNQTSNCIHTWDPEPNQAWHHPSVP